MANLSAAIQAVDLTVRFAGLPVLQAVSLAIAPGEIVALTGDNGAGKTTLLRCLAWIARPQSGAVLWHGHPASRIGPLRALVGLAMHESAVYPYLTARENLVFAARMHGLDQAARRGDAWLERTSLMTFSDQPAAMLSKGMRQRLALARALIHEPAIILLDEPFAGLDSRSANWLEDLLRDYGRRGHAVYFSTHDHTSAEALGDRVTRLDRGQLEVLPARGASPSRAA